MAQRKRPREDALLETERSHQRRCIELLKEKILRLAAFGRSWRRSALICLRRIWTGPGE